MSQYPHEQPMDEQDAAVLDSIAHLYDSLDPPPASLNAGVLVALTWAELDAELATLLDDEARVLRSPETEVVESVTFTSSAMQLMVNASTDGAGTLRIDAWVTGGGVEVALYLGAESRWAVSDANGRLAWRKVPRGRIRFLIQPMDPESKPVLTPVVEF
ncbi:hypothetical protein OK351_03510 [Glutamicibacter sp. MNS18]|uniref:hypothetical protein n=1 Tax=Glutamicibacter sp. MNS18 TaxID=2989817 RepID=UPI0022367A4D|nr:hypothetical protein [Glutamicibacter sp. MNS18]MCW4464574.1 hypothetical protein [Glutamicibacter sp. MNS18]